MKKNVRRRMDPVQTEQKKVCIFRHIILGSCILFTALMLLFFIRMPDRSFSETENRSLQGAPDLNMEEIRNGRFMKNTENWAADQFPGRTGWVKVRTEAARIGGQNMIGGVYICDDGYLMEEAVQPDEEFLSRLVQNLTAFRAKHQDMNFYMMIAPTAVTVLRDKLPENAPAGDQNALIRAFCSTMQLVSYTPIDVGDVLSAKKNEYIYYRTDHHWTTYGAYNAFRRAAEIMGLDPDAVTYDARPVTADFNGTLSAKSGTFADEKDVISVWFPQDDALPAANYVVEYVDQQMKTTTFYDETFLTQKDKYGVFFGGNHALVRIKAPTAEDRRLLVLKDSYANCFLPFLAQYYRQIDVVDPRYFTDDLETLIATDGIDEVLFLYNANTFFSDSSLAGLLTQ
ncbi:MAG: hypothetical protein J6E44_08495 [Lachnospiraceae bacterium]|nr:hypothetical protein [Lachnospiraceae bacterium]